MTSLLSVSLALGLTPILQPTINTPIHAKLAPTTGSLNLLVCDVLDSQNNPVYQWDPASPYTIRMVFKSTGWLTHEAVQKDELKVGQVIKSVQADLLKSDFCADAGTVKLLSNANDPFQIEVLFKNAKWLKVGQVIKSVQADLLKSDFCADAGTVKLLSNANDPFQIEVLFKNAKWVGPGNNVSWAITYPAAQKPGINGSIPIVATDNSNPTPDAPPMPEAPQEGGDQQSDSVEGWNEFSGDPNEDPGDTAPEAPKPAAAAPNLIIDNYSYGGTSVQAGKTFDLSINFMNTSRALAVENIVMSLETAEGISIANSSNTFYFETLKPRHNITQNITLRATGKGENSSPTIGVNFRYEYIDQNQRMEITRSETIAIPVTQPERFEITEPTLPEMQVGMEMNFRYEYIDQNQRMEITRSETIAIPVTQPERFEITEPTLPEMQVGMENVLSFPYVNKGKGTLYNVAVKIEGDVDALQPVQNLGNFESGRSGTIDAIFTTTQEGPGKGTLYNVAVKIEGDVDALQPVQNLGNFESGRSGTIDAIFTTTQEGPTPFKIIVTYEDADGNEKKREFKYEPTVMAMPEPELPPEMMDPMDPQLVEQPSHNWMWIVGVILIVALGGGFWWFKKRKKKTNKVSEAEKENEEIDWFTSHNWMWIVGVILIVALGGGFWWFKKRKKKTNKVSEAEKENEEIDWFKKEDLEIEQQETKQEAQPAPTPKQETPTSSHDENVEE